MNKQTELRKLKLKLDKLWRIQVGGPCAICGSTTRINMHHMVTKRNQWGRWFVPNGLPLCSKHHKFSVSCSAHQAPTNLIMALPDKRDKKLWFACIAQQTDRVKGEIDYAKVEAHLRGERDDY